MKLNLQSEFGLGLIAVLLVTTLISLFGLKTMQDRNAADQWVSHTHAVINSSNQVLLGLVSMETGFRGFMLTGTDDFLQPYTDGKKQYQAAIQQLISLSSDNPDQVLLWKDVQTKADQWDTQWIMNGILLRKQVSSGKVPLQDAMSYISTGNGKAMTDAIRTELTKGQQNEEDLLLQRTQTQKQVNNLVAWVTVGGVALSVILGLAIGYAMTRSVNTRNKKMEMQHLLIEEREKERLKIARDIHDGPVQDLIGLTFMNQEAMQIEDPSSRVEKMEEIQNGMRQLVNDLRQYSNELRPPTLMKFGFEAAIRSYLDGIQEKHPNIKVHLEVQQGPPILPEVARVAFFRIFQEAFNNILYHAEATEVDVRFIKDDRKVELTIRDDGHGFTLPQDWLDLAHAGHLGLVGIRERAEALGGTAKIISQPNKGTRIQVVVPIHQLIQSAEIDQPMEAKRS